VRRDLRVGREEKSMRVHHDTDSLTWDLTWKDVCFRLRLADGVLMGEHFGPAGWLERMGALKAVPDALVASRAMCSIGLSPGSLPVQWKLAGWSQPDPLAFQLELAAVDLPLAAELRLAADRETGLLTCRAELANTGREALPAIQHAVTAGILLPPDLRDVTWVAGRWGAETQVQRQPLSAAALVLESRSGKTGFEYQPYAALSSPDHTVVAELLWSGNWEMQARRLPDGRVHLSAGLNDWGLRHGLWPGEKLELPGVFLLCAKGDLNAATQKLHEYRRRFPLPDNQHPIPVQYNSWYAFSERVPVAKMKEAAAAAAELGCESFVLDAGWYTTEVDRPGEGWWLRAGDWAVDRKWFPNGLAELSDYCHTKGIDFGIWFEPEAVGPGARIRREHPEWLHAAGGRVTPPDQRGILNLGVPEARACVRERILEVLRSTKAEWMKWDFNTDLGQGGWAPGTPAELAHQDPLIAHYRGLYQLQADIRQALPTLTLEMCAGGGGRFDAAIMANAHVNWMSDQTQPLMNLAIHFGSHLAHCAFECNDWLVEWPPHSAAGAEADVRGDLAFRLRVAMLGSFGLSAPLDRWTEEDRAVARAHITWYKQIIQPIILNGDQYFLTDPPPLDGNGDWAAAWYAARNGERGVLFAFRLAGTDPQRLLALPGLAPEARYRLRTPEGWTEVRAGDELAEGLLVEIDEHFHSALIYVEHLNGA
jgi:alpha-galactosidase